MVWIVCCAGFALIELWDVFSMGWRIERLMLHLDPGASSQRRDEDNNIGGIMLSLFKCTRIVGGSHCDQLNVMMLHYRLQICLCASSGGSDAVQG